MALADIVEVACDDSWPGVKLVQISTLVAQQLRRNDRRQRPCWPPAAKWARLSGRKSWIFWMTPQLGSLPVRQATSRFPIPRRWSSSAGRLPRSKRMSSTFPRMSGTFTRWHGSKPMPASIAMNGRRRRRPDGRCQQSFPVGHPLAHRQECDASVRRAGRLADEGYPERRLSWSWSLSMSRQAMSPGLADRFAGPRREDIGAVQHQAQPPVGERHESGCRLADECQR